LPPIVTYELAYQRGPVAFSLFPGSFDNVMGFGYWEPKMGSSEILLISNDRKMSFLFFLRFFLDLLLSKSKGFHSVIS